MLPPTRLQAAGASFSKGKRAENGEVGWGSLYAPSLLRSCDHEGCCPCRQRARWLCSEQLLGLQSSEAILDSCQPLIRDPRRRAFGGTYCGELIFSSVPVTWTALSSSGRPGPDEVCGRFWAVGCQVTCRFLLQEAASHGFGPNTCFSCCTSSSTLELHQTSSGQADGVSSCLDFHRGLVQVRMQCQSEQPGTGRWGLLERVIAGAEDARIQRGRAM